MKILILSSCFPDTIANMYDEAFINKQIGKEVFVVDCSRIIGVCWHNLESNSMRCHFCEKYRKMMHRKVDKDVHFLDVKSYINQTDIDSVEKLKFNYNTISDIKRIEYMGVKIGYCCISIYFSKTRNNNPLIDDQFKNFFDHLLSQTALYTRAINNIIDTIEPCQIFVFNGRCTNSRPGVELAKQKGIDYICSEVKTVFPGKKVRRYFHNALPHSIELNTKMVFDTWDHSTLNEVDKNYLGRWFYESKIKKLYSGDISYTACQKDGKLPEDWDPQKHNIVIFNSSEDEFSAVGDEFESKQLFKSQIEGIRFIASTLENQKGIRLYLRIHPNLKTIPYKYHTDLLELGNKYNCLTVIPGGSTVSTYEMIKRSDKIIVFGSTTGAEAAYQKKPVILLCGSLYYNMDFCYIPHSEGELRNLLTERDLKTKFNDNVIKMSYYWMDYFLPTPTFISIERTYKYITFLGKCYSISLYPYKVLLGSKLLCRFWEKICEYFSNRLSSHKYVIPTREV